MPQFLFALLLTLATDTVTPGSIGHEPTWLHGRWLHVAISSTASPQGVNPILGEKHLLVFQPDGQLRRYSPQKGWARLLMDFKVSEETVLVRPHTQDHFSPMAERTKEGLLKVWMPKHGFYYYRKIDAKTPLKKIDFAPPELSARNHPTGG